MDPIAGSDALLQGLLMPSLRADYEALDAAARGADPIVTHPITFAGPIIAQARRLPWVSTVLAPMSFFSAIGCSCARTGAVSRSPARVSVRGTGARWLRLCARQTRRWMKPVFDLRRELGLPPGRHPLVRRTVFANAHACAFSRACLRRRSRTGRRTCRSPDLSSTTVPMPLQPDLEEFLDAGPPPVVFTLGTSAVAAAGSFYEESRRRP